MNSRQLSMDTRKLAVKVLPTTVKQTLLRRRWDFLDAAIKVREVTGRLGPLPDFLIIGGQRCGTTYLYDRVCEHPEICGALVKEIHFFNRETYYVKGPDWYRGNFPSLDSLQSNNGQGGRKITGEAAGYLFHPLGPSRIADLIPDVKIIGLLRNPVDRAYSHYHHMRRLGYEEAATFEEALELEGDRLRTEVEAGLFGAHHHHHSYLARGIYADQLQAWFDAFPSEQLLFIQSEELYRDPTSVLKNTATYLGLPGWQPEEYSGHKQFPYSDLKPETRAWLEEYFRLHNERLFDMLGVDYGWNE
jgi:hypothetical protein